MTRVPAGGIMLTMKFGQRGLDAYKAQSKPLPSRSDKKSTPGDAALSAMESIDSSKKTPPGLLKTGKESAIPSLREGEAAPEELKGIAKAARFILLLDKEEAGSVLRNMNEREIELITREIARIRSVSLEEARTVLEDFGSALPPHKVAGGLGMAREILNRAFGEEKSREFLKKSVPESFPAPFSFLNDLSLPQMMQLLKDESLETLSVILSFLDPQKASGIIKSRPSEDQVKLIRRMGRIDKVDPAILSSMEGILQERVHKLAKVDEVEIDGASRLTEILRFMDPQSESTILSELDNRDPDLGRRIREDLLTMDSVFKLRPRDLQTLLMDIPNETLILLLKDKDQDVTDHIMENLSTQRRMLLEEDRILAPLVPRSEVKKVTREFLETIRRKQEEGSFILLDEDDDLLV